MKKSTRLLLWISILGFVLFTATTVVLVLVLSGDRVLKDDEPRTLVLEVGPSLGDAPREAAFVMNPQDFPPLLTEVTAAVRRAAGDPEVAGLLVLIEPLTIGFGGVQELASALEAFRAAGKPCVAHADEYGNKEYLLAAACGTVEVSPAGIVLVNGLQVTETYLKDTLDRIGVDPELEHVGEFKTAVEPFERTGPSEEARMATDAVLDSLYGQFVDALARTRGMEAVRVRTLLDDPPLTPAMALEDGLVDAVAFESEAREAAGGDDILDFDDYVEATRRTWRKGPKVAVVHADGSIVSGGSGSGILGGRFVGDEDLVDLLDEVRKDDDVVAVVLRVNSPGGSGLASDTIWWALQEVRQAKPVVVSMSDLAASGGYFIAVGSDHIVAEPGTLTGSIGVFGGKMNLAGLYGKLGMTRHVYKRGEMADLLSSTSAFSDAGRTRFRSYLDAFYQLFLSRVAEGRNLAVEEVHTSARGRVWTGEQALERGLVDELGGLDVAIDRARELAEVEGPYGILRLPAQKTLFEQIMKEITNPDAGASRVALAALPIAGDGFAMAETLARVLDGAGVAAMLPGTLEVR